MADTAPKRLEIKKYPNRRYYDATHSRHLTLEEIRSRVQEGCDLRVIDARTSADITAQVLTQIILELDSGKLESFPVPLLLRIIRVNDQLVKDFVEKYFNQALCSFLAYQERVERQLREAQGLPPSFPSVAAWTKAMLGPLAAGAAAEPAGGGGGLEAELRALQRQVAELQRAAGGKRKRQRSRKK